MASPPRRPPWACLARQIAFYLHIAGGLALALAWYPLISRARRLKLKAAWSRRLLSILGLRLELRGELAPGALLVSNHVSWIDIFVLNAARPSAFVAKSEIATWPVAGWLCRKTDTIFIERGSHRHAQHVAHDMAKRLSAGESIAFFPEGTTTDGDTLLPFHAALFQPAITTGAAVQPILIRYRDRDGRFTRAPAYAGETTFGESLSLTLAEIGLAVEVVCLPAIPAAGTERRVLAAQCQAAIAAVMAGEPG